MTQFDRRHIHAHHNIAKKLFFQTRFMFSVRGLITFLFKCCSQGNERGNAHLGESIITRLPDTENEQSKVTTVLQAIGNSKRLRILNELANGRERSVSELETVIANLSQSALSQHPSRLRRANIVRTRCES